MSQAKAIAEAKRLKAIMDRHGVRCSIELQPGRPWSGDIWYSRKYVIMNHHTAGPKTGKTPSLAVVKNGRGGANPLPGPLANGYGGRDFVYRIVTMGLANHPGEGGPLTVAGFRIPEDSARISCWGTEWEHTGVDPWPSDMQEFMGRSNAALCEFLDVPPERSIEHSTWTSRKIDRNRYTAALGAAEIRRWQRVPEPVPVAPKLTLLEDIMSTPEERAAFATVVAAAVLDAKKPVAPWVAELLGVPAGQTMAASLHELGQRAAVGAALVGDLASTLDGVRADVTRIAEDDGLSAEERIALARDVADRVERVQVTVQTLPPAVTQ